MTFISSRIALFYLTSIIRASQWTPVSFVLCQGAAVIMLFLSVYSSKGNMLSTPLPLSLSAVSLCLSHFFIAHSLREQLAFWMLSPLCEHTLIGSPLPQKQSSMGCRQPAFCWCCSKRSLQGEEIIRRLHHNLSRYVCSLFLPASPTVMRINGV